MTEQVIINCDNSVDVDCKPTFRRQDDDNIETKAGAAGVNVNVCRDSGSLVSSPVKNFDGSKVSSSASLKNSNNDLCTKAVDFSNVKNKLSQTGKKVDDWQIQLFNLERELMRSALKRDVSYGLSLAQMTDLAGQCARGVSNKSQAILQVSHSIAQMDENLLRHAECCRQPLFRSVAGCTDHSEAGASRVMRDMLSAALVKYGCGYKSRNVLLVLPNELLLPSEQSRLVSDEGVPLFPKRQSISFCTWFRLAALRQMIVNFSGRKSRRLDRKKIGWLHEVRRKTLKHLCITSEKQKVNAVLAILRNITLYRYFNT